MAVRKKGGLGKGIDALIVPSAKTEKKVEQVIVEKPIEKIVEKIVEKPVEMKVKISKVGPNREQPRKQFNEDALEYIVDKTSEYKLGARGLRGIMEDIMTKAMFNMASEDTKELTITLDYVKEKLENK